MFLKRKKLQRFDPSALNLSQFVGFQDSPNLSKIEKVAETCEFDGKEPLFVERTIAISITPVAGLIFETKNRAIFLERFLRGIFAQNSFLGQKMLLDYK